MELTPHSPLTTPTLGPMGRSILLVDDDPFILMSLEFLMRKNGYTVHIARNGTEALEAFAANTPDLVVLDVMMPDIDGFTVCERIKNTPQGTATPVVFLSAKSTEKDAQRAQEVGGSLYITKPFSTRQLVKSLEDLLSKS